MNLKHEQTQEDANIQAAYPRAVVAERTDIVISAEQKTATETVDRHLRGFVRLARRRRDARWFVGIFGAMLFLTFYAENIPRSLAKHQIDLISQQTKALQEFKKSPEEAMRRVDQYQQEWERIEKRIGTLENIDLWLGVLALVGLLAGALVGISAETGQRRLALSLAESEDPRIIGPLADALTPIDAGKPSVMRRLYAYFPFSNTFTGSIVSDKKQQQQLKSILAGLLARLPANEAAQLSEAPRACLARALRECEIEDETLIVAILNTFTQIGDGRIAGTAAALAAMDTPTENARRIKEAAQTCLPTLRHHAEQEQHSTTLLRSSDKPATPSEALLRPAENASDANPSLLLRPETPEQTPGEQAPPI